MRNRHLFTVLVLLAACASSLDAAVWDEPWHREVVAKADAFGLYEVVMASPSKALLKEIRHLAGAQTGSDIEVDGFYGGEPLSLLSRNGLNDDEWTLRLRGSGARYYFFLKKAPTGTTWRIASPTAGFARIQPDGKVVASFRISIHQAILDTGVYELTQTCIYQKLHKQECAEDAYKYIREQLSLEPAALADNAPPEQADRFFKQHAALETAYLIGHSVDRETLAKFLKSSVFHTQISAVRALGASDSRERDAMLIAFITDDSRNLLARVFAVRTVREISAKELKDPIAAYIPKAPTEKTGLGISVMDSRVGTSFPDSLKTALEDLVAEWK